MAVATKTSPNKVVKIKKIKKVPEGRGVINGYFSFNNTILTLTKENGDVLVQVSAGNSGFRNTKKATPYSTQKVTEKIIAKAADYGINKIKLQVRGIGVGREIVTRKIIEEKSLVVEELVDKTPVPFNGTRPPKKPRK